MATAAAGSLYIDFVTNLAKLQADMNQMKRTVGGAVDSVSASLGSGNTATERYANAMEQMAARSTRFVASGRQVVVSAGQQRAGMQQLSFQIGDVAQQFALGTNPMTIFAQQGGQVIQAISLMKGGATGLIGFLAGPWGAVIMGAATILGMLASKTLGARDAAVDMQKAQSDLARYVDFTTGKIKQQISAIVALAEAQRQGTKAQQAADAYKKSRQALIDAGTLGGADTAGFGLGTNLSAVTQQLTKSEQEVRRLVGLYQAGTINVMKLGQELKKIGDADPKIRARTQSLIAMGEAVNQSADANRLATATMRVLTGTANDQDRAFLALQGGTSAHAKSVNSLIEAQARLEASTDRVTTAQARLQILQQRAPEFTDPKSKAAIQYQHEYAAALREVDVAQQAVRDDKKAEAAARAEERHNKALATAAEHHAEMLARDASAMDASARSAMALAAAYLGAEEGADGIVNAVGAAVIAEARHRAASEATKKGIDEEAQTRRVLANMVADGLVQAGKTVYQLRTETTMRNDLNAQLEAGKISIGEYNEQLKEGAALKPLIDLQAAAKAKGLTEAYDLLTKAIEAMKGAMADSRASLADAEFTQAKKQGEDEIERLKLEYKLIGATNEQRAVELAMLAKKQQPEGVGHDARAAEEADRPGRRDRAPDRA
jgi:hypothetical protein